MGAGGVGGVAGIVADVAEEGASGDEDFCGAGWKIGSDEAVALGIGHVGVVGPDLLGGMEGIGRNANDDGGDPVGFTGEIAVVDGIDGGGAGRRAGEEIDAGMAMTGAIGFVPETKDDAIDGDLEGSIGAGGVGGEGVVTEVEIAIEPTTIAAPAGGVGGGTEIASEDEKGRSGDDEEDAEQEEEKRAFVFGGGNGKWLHIF